MKTSVDELRALLMLVDEYDMDGNEEGLALQASVHLPSLCRSVLRVRKLLETRNNPDCLRADITVEELTLALEGP